MFSCIHYSVIYYAQIWHGYFRDTSWAWTLILHKKSEASGMMQYDTLPFLDYPHIIVYNPCLVSCKGFVFVHDTRFCLLRISGGIVRVYM